MDLSFRAGVPSFAEVLEGLLDEPVVEGAITAREITGRNPEAAALLEGRFPDGLPEPVPHEELKVSTRDARLVVRTGETRPYANALLRCGVPY